VLQAYTKGFKAAYGIDLVLQSLTQGPMQERLSQEFQAGKIQADVAGNTLDGAWNAKAAADGHLAELTLAELPNLATLQDKHKGKYYVINRLNPMGVYYNTGLLNESELPKSTVDIPKLTKLKGRVAIISPQLGGAVHEWHYRLLQDLGKDRYEAFVKGLVGGLKANVSSAVSAVVGQVTAGELAAVVGVPSSLTIPSINAGAPAKIYYPEPVTVYRSSLQALAKGPHPNAAKLFINWMLSEDGAKASCGNGVCAPPHLQIEGQIKLPANADFVDGVEARKTGDTYINGLVAAAAS
jgi:iron(III) transport system substrate-binding protein